MSTDAGDDMDVYIGIRKLDTDGNPLYYLNIPLRDMPSVPERTVPDDNVHKYIGPNGLQRASWTHTLLEEPGLSAEARKLTTPGEVTLSFTKENKIRPGQS
ncbi:hypothetical protein BJY00DRAFT_318643 [Aspergillus carlsbadensis]|nr:hypothetical protein BJY00DRAFT_318643 [Aspergillus carlsbadensis]